MCSPMRRDMCVDLGSLRECLLPCTAALRAEVMQGLLVEPEDPFVVESMCVSQCQPTRSIPAECHLQLMS